MRSQSSIRKTSALGLAVFALVLSGFVTAASATPATEHWAGTSQPAAPFVPYGTQQEFTAKKVTNFGLDWYIGGAKVVLSCTELSASGTVENPAGGGAGVVHSGSLTLSGCEVSSSPTKCEVENGTIPLSPLSSTSVEAGRDLIKTSGALNTMTIKSRPGQSCVVAGSHKVEGQLALQQATASPGYYEFGGPGSTLGIDGYSATLSGEISVKTPSGKLLTESSIATPGVPHWFVGSSKWTTFSSGQSVKYQTGGTASVTIKSIIFGTAVEVSCGAAGTGLSGSLENPVGGGAGTSKAQLNLVGCALLKPSPSKCAVAPATIVSNPLSGVTKEVSGVPTVEYSPSEGSVLLTLAFQKAPGATLCAWEGSYNLTGKIRASSVGDGNFELAGFEQKLGVNSASMSGNLLLESEAGEALRLQP